MFALNGLWLAGGLALAFLAGIFLSQWIKDKISGIPADLRTALSASQTAALNEIETAKKKVVADVAATFAKKAVAPVPAAAVAKA
jgi:hypothetical protein